MVSASLKDPKINVRAVARDPGSEGAYVLREKGVEVVHEDVTDASSLVAAFKVS